MSHCPTPQQLEQMLDEQLTGTDRNAVTLHVGACAACQSMLENLTADTDKGDASLTVVLRQRGEGPGRPGGSL